MVSQVMAIVCDNPSPKRYFPLSTGQFDGIE